MLNVLFTRHMAGGYFESFVFKTTKHAVDSYAGADIIRPYGSARGMVSRIQFPVYRMTA